MKYGGYLTTLPHAEKFPSPQQRYPEYWTFCGLPIRPASPYRRSVYDNAHFDLPMDVLCERYGTCDISRRPLCMLGGTSKCKDGKSWCYTGLPYQTIGSVNSWHDGFSLQQDAFSQ